MTIPAVAPVAPRAAAPQAPAAAGGDGSFAPVTKAGRELVDIAERIGGEVRINNLSKAGRPGMYVLTLHISSHSFFPNNAGAGGVQDLGQGR